MTDDQHKASRSLSIYPSALPLASSQTQPPSTLPPVLYQDFVGQYRRLIVAQLDSLFVGIHSAVDAWISVETKARQTVNTYWSPNERAWPSLLYVGVAATAGSVLFQQRGVLTRLSMPVLFAGGAMAYFLPLTSQRIVQHLSPDWKQDVAKHWQQLKEAVQLK